MPNPPDPDGERQPSNDYDDCLQAAFRYLSYRARSTAEVKTHLRRRGFSGPALEQTLQRLTELKLTDDAAFARFWKENRETFSPRSRAMLRFELSRKGVDPEIAAQELEDLDEVSSARRAAAKKMRSLTGLAQPELKQKLLRFLRGRGFAYNVCEQVINQLLAESEARLDNAEENPAEQQVQA